MGNTGIRYDRRLIRAFMVEKIRTQGHVRINDLVREFRMSRYTAKDHLNSATVETGLIQPILVGAGKKRLIIWIKSQKI